MKFFGPHRPERVLLRRNTLYSLCQEVVDLASPISRKEEFTNCVVEYLRNKIFDLHFKKFLGSSRLSMLKDKFSD